MSSSAELHVAYKVANAPLNLFPYPHLYVQDIFPRDFYGELLSNLPGHEAMQPIQDARPVSLVDQLEAVIPRFVLELGSQIENLPEEQRAFWGNVHRWLVGGRFGQLALSKFSQFLGERLNDPTLQYYDEALLVEDRTDYQLGPHTDSPKKVLSFLFYLPRDDSQRHLGTSIYLPKNPAFRCPGGPHYAHDAFERLWTMPFLPNSLFAFLKTDISFHGVEPVEDADCRRWLLLYDVKVEQIAPAPTQAQIAPNVKFSF